MNIIIIIIVVYIICVYTSQHYARESLLRLLYLLNWLWTRLIYNIMFDFNANGFY